MGKYMRKADATSDVAVMDVSQSSVGVRTRAKTLALRRLQSTGAAPSLKTPDSYYYLELRSRRLEKPLQLQTSRRVRRSCRCEVDGLEIEASLGENVLNTEVRERCHCLLGHALDVLVPSVHTSIFKQPSLCYLRSGALIGTQISNITRGSCSCTIFRAGSIDPPHTPYMKIFGILLDTRESTPCSSTMGSVPGPASGSNAASRRGALDSLFTNVSAPFEVEEFFTHEEQALQRLFTEKYNFDFVNELPVPGRYEWVKVNP